ncbi:MAG: cobalamin-dependent protein, partial [Clostridia bacterium]
IRARMPAREGDGGRKIVLATVHGDVHDIGKNIVKVLLQNYGFTVIDLGKDVPPQRVLAAAREQAVRLVGLSALMTTTVPAMGETIALLHRELPEVKVIVGGAVLTQAYAHTLGADGYAKDAMASVRLAEQFLAQ